MEQDFQTKFDDVIVQKPVIFGDFMNANMDPRPYNFIEDHNKVSREKKKLFKLSYGKANI